MNIFMEGFTAEIEKQAGKKELLAGGLMVGGGMAVGAGLGLIRGSAEMKKALKTPPEKRTQRQKKFVAAYKKNQERKKK